VDISHEVKPVNKEMQNDYKIFLQLTNVDIRTAILN